MRSPSLPDVSIDVSVIGIGRIGLPLALSFADRGLTVLGVDADPERLAAVAEGRMPFDEPGAQEALDRVHASGRLELSDSVADAARAENIVITLGTPSFSHIEIDIRDIRSALDDLLAHLRPGQTIVLRSTVAPGTTDFVAGYIAKHLGMQVGEDVFVAHVPERIAAGRFFEEIDTLPCIVGGVGAQSGSGRRGCSTCSPPRSSRRRRCRPSSRRSGPTSCATRRSRCPTS